MNASQSITIVIDAQAVPKGRPRLSKWGRVYTPSETVAYEAVVRLAAKVAMAGRPPFRGPVRADVHIELGIPESWSAAKRAMAIVGEIRPAVRPDTDNFCKSIFDGLNSVVYEDDGQIVEVNARKVYGVGPKAVVTITALEIKPASLPAARKLDPEIEKKLFGPAPFASGLPEWRRR